MKAKLYFLVLIISLYFSHSSKAEELIAVNVALAVRGELEGKVKAINSELKSNNESSFSFDSEHFPHLTILQFYTNKKQLDSFIRGLTVENWRGLKLKVKDFETSPLEKDASMKLLNLVFNKNGEITNLQKMIAFKSTLSRKPSGSKSAFADPDVDQQFVKYVSEYIDKETGVNYSPHVTLGIVTKWDRDNSSIKPNEEFIFDEIIISQMGNYGTIRKVFKIIKLDAPHLK